MPVCRKCKKELIWPTNWKKGAKPVEPDRNQSKHICKGDKISCELCPEGKVMASANIILAHKRICHPNNEKINSWQWELRFQNKFMPHKMRKSDNIDKESKETDFNSLDIY